MTSLPAGRTSREKEEQRESANGSSALPNRVSKPAKGRGPPRLVVSSLQNAAADPPLFSPTHTFPTDPLLYSSPEHFNLRPLPLPSLQSIQSCFRHLSSNPSNIRPSAYNPPNSLKNNRDNSFDSQGSSSSSDLGLAVEAPITLTSPRFQLPSIQTAFSKPPPENLSQRSAVESSKSTGSFAFRGFSLPKKSLPSRHGSSAYSTPTTTMTTPSSTGLHQGFHFSPIVNHGGLLIHSPATSSGGYSHLRHDYMARGSGDEMNLQIVDASTRQHMAQVALGKPVKQTTSLMLRTRLRSDWKNNHGVTPSFARQDTPSDGEVEISANCSRLATSELHGDKTLNARQSEVRNLKINQKASNLVTKLNFAPHLQVLNIDLDPGPLFHRVIPVNSQSSLSVEKGSGRFSHLEAGGRRDWGREEEVSGRRLFSHISNPFQADDDNTTRPSTLPAQSSPTDLEAGFNLHGEACILLLYVTEAAPTLSSSTRNLLERSGAIHIDIPNDIIAQQRWRSEINRRSTHFIFLEPYLVDEMSKRKYSELSGLGPSQDQKPYWHRDIVLIGDEETSDDSDDHGNQGRHAYNMPTTPGKGIDTSVAVQVFAEAVQDLSSGDELTRGIYYLQGGIDGLQNVYPPFNSASLSRQRQNTNQMRKGDIFDSRSVSPTNSLNLLPPSRLSESPGRIVANQEGKSLSLPPPAACLTAPSKAARPMLARLNTSEATRKVSALPSAELARLAPLSTSRLTLDTNIGKARAATTIGHITQRGDASADSPSVLHVRELRRESAPGQSVERSLSKATSRSTPSGNFTLASIPAPLAPFEPSEILSNFLYLGPDITKPSEVEYLQKKWGIKRILNAAFEIEDGGGKDLNLNNAKSSGIEKYIKIPMKDTVEAQGVQRDIEEACAFLDDAKLHSAPVYVHCKAGKSRSVLLVMAYLIHSNRWTLSKVYSYVVERRQTVSPNIGFVAELMTFEERRLQTKRNASSSTRPELDSSQDSPKKWSNRDSLPTCQSNPSRVLSLWDQLTATQDQDQEEEDAMKISPRVVANNSTVKTNQRNDNQRENEKDQSGRLLHQLGATSLNEYRDSDGRYHAKRPPADDVLLAPTRRATMAAIDSEHDFNPNKY